MAVLGGTTQHYQNQGSVVLRGVHTRHAVPPSLSLLRPVQLPTSLFCVCVCCLALAMPPHARSAFVLGLDPGSKVSYFALRVDRADSSACVTDAVAVGADSPVCTVLGFGSVAVDFHKDSPVLDMLTKPREPKWELDELSKQHGAQTLFGLVECCRRSVDELLLVWERQRGYLHEHLGAAFMAQAGALGWAVRVMAPAEKFHRLGVSSNKQVREACPHALMLVLNVLHCKNWAFIQRLISKLAHF